LFSYIILKKLVKLTSLLYQLKKN